MSASKNRPRWHELPPSARSRIERLAGGTVVAAQNCPGGYSPGFASRLALAPGGQVFVKAIDASEWPLQADFYRAEARVAAVLPAAVPAPSFRGCADDGDWVILAFDSIDGAEPARPWRPAELEQVAAVVSAIPQALTPSPLPAPAGRVRLGGWADIAADPAAAARLAAASAWAQANLDALIRLEQAGLTAAQGCTLAHFDVLPFNILRTRHRVWLVDWSHARPAAPFVDLLMLLASAGEDGLDLAWLDALLARQPVVAGQDPAAIDAVLAALTGFYLAGALRDIEPGLHPVAAAKRELGRASLRWLRHRLGAPGRRPHLP